MISKQRKLYEKPNKRWTAVGEKNETKDKREKIIHECFCSGMRQCYNRPIPIYENSNLAARRGGIKQKKWNHLEAQYIENDLFQYSHVSLKTQWKGLRRKLKRSFFLERLWSSGLLTVFSWLKILLRGSYDVGSMIEILPDLTSAVWNFCRWVADVLPSERSPAAGSEEEILFSQTIASIASV